MTNYLHSIKNLILCINHVTSQFNNNNTYKYDTNATK